MQIKLENQVMRKCYSGVTASNVTKALADFGIPITEETIQQVTGALFLWDRATIKDVTFMARRTGGTAASEGNLVVEQITEQSVPAWALIKRVGDSILFIESTGILDDMEIALAEEVSSAVFTSAATTFDLHLSDDELSFAILRATSPTGLTLYSAADDGVSDITYYLRCLD